MYGWFIWPRSPDTTPEEFENTTMSTITESFCICVWGQKTRSGKSQGYRDAIAFEKLRLQNVFRPYENENPAFSISSG